MKKFFFLALSMSFLMAQSEVSAKSVSSNQAKTSSITEAEARPATNAGTQPTVRTETQPVTKTETQPEVLVKTLSRWAIFAEFVPGYFSKEGYDVDLGEFVGVAFYPMDTCRNAKQESCVNLSVHLKIGNINTIPFPVSTLEVLAGVETAFFFGSQRRIAWTLQANLGYRFTAKRGDGNFTFDPHTLDMIGGTGLLVAVYRGLQLYARVEYQAPWDVLFPMGLRYRF